MTGIPDLKKEIKRLSTLVNPKMSYVEMVKTIEVNMCIKDNLIGMRECTKLANKTYVNTQRLLDTQTISITALVYIYVTLPYIETFISHSIFGNNVINVLYGSIKEILHTFESGDKYVTFIKG